MLRPWVVVLERYAGMVLSSTSLYQENLEAPGKDVNAAPVSSLFVAFPDGKPFHTFPGNALVPFS